MFSHAQVASFQGHGGKFHFLSTWEHTGLCETIICSPVSFGTSPHFQHHLVKNKSNKHCNMELRTLFLNTQPFTHQIGMAGLDVKARSLQDPIPCAVLTRLSQHLHSPCSWAFSKPFSASALFSALLESCSRKVYIYVPYVLS